MRFDKFTIKSQELIESSHSLAVKNNNQQIEPEHMLKGMLEDNTGIAVSLIRKIGISIEELKKETDELIQKLPKIAGGEQKAYLSTQLNALLDKALKESETMKDDYVSIEHILLAFLDSKKSTVLVLSRKSE